mmetsp:Transcript_24422/g.84908  ORF Transcript_24422/g.84908 Transcript_24422/m.84908 type:complete len:523 (+) Transcript_24422:2222-3790(+)
MQRCVSRSDALDTEMSGASAPWLIMMSCWSSAVAMLPSVTAPKRRYVVSAEHRNVTSWRTDTELTNCRWFAPMQPDSDMLHSAASTSCCTPTSSQSVSASNGVSAPALTSSTRISASTARPRIAATARRCASRSSLPASRMSDSRQPSSMSMRWFSGADAKFATPWVAALRTSTSSASMSVTSSRTTPASMSDSCVERLAATLVSAITAYRCESMSPLSKRARRSSCSSAPSATIFSWLPGLAARLPRPMAAYRWHMASGDDSVATSGGKAPPEASSAVCANSAARLPIARAASRCTSTLLECSTNFRCCRTPSATMRPWFSSTSARLARTPVAWCASSTSPACVNSTSVLSAPALTIATLFDSESDRLRYAAAISRCSSTEGDGSAASSASGSRPPRATMSRRFFGCSASRRSAMTACMCVSGSSRRAASEMSGLMRPMRSATTWFSSLAHRLLKANATQRRVSMSLELATSTIAAIAGRFSSCLCVRGSRARLPRPSAAKRWQAASLARKKPTMCSGALA